ncbi:endoglucanase C precursor [Oxobacter pfennigii]|uniref:Endoglucanase C n=1 Tax=Oxobacter pfennigii TaxID=36849 RepID=A0A0P9ADS4_9CLOT|nr:immunoglobulin-like domain-containing protein [Oxobacter pfennigii]KPU43342.1 endoglucanase C precursor [Oxobacter pfennigii]
MQQKRRKFCTKLISMLLTAVMIIGMLPLSAFAAESPLSISAHPEDAEVKVGQTAAFNVTAEGGDEPYSYQWESNGGTDWEEIEGANSEVYVTSPTVISMNGYKYRCKVTDDSNASVTSDEATLTVEEHASIAISAHPEDAEVKVGQTAAFSVTAEGGDEPYSYQWESNDDTGWEEIEGATSGVYVTSPTVISMDGYKYRCTVTDSSNESATSDEATLTVEEYFSGGKGTESEPYLISSKDDLANLSDYIYNGSVNEESTRFNVMYYKQTADINLGGSSSGSWTPIGRSGTNYVFKGYYDGDKNNITGLYIKNTSTPVTAKIMGLFGYLNGATIKNVNIISPDIEVSGSQQGAAVAGTGALAGAALNSSIQSCTVQGGTIKSDYWAGGLVGLLQASVMGATATVEGCYTDIDVSSSGNAGVGGVVGFINFNNNSKDGVITVKDCYSMGDVSCTHGSKPLIGGVVGGNNQATAIDTGSITIENCYATGTINGKAGNTKGAGIGGITGTPNSSAASSTAQIKNNAAINKEIKNESTPPNTNDEFGRISGVEKSGSFSGNIAWDGMKVKGAAVTGGASDKNGEPKTMAEIKTKSTWEALGFNFTNTWEWDEDLSYPKLKGLPGQNANPFPEAVNLPIISAQPENITVAAGQGAVFSVTASGDSAILAYQWESNDGTGWEEIEEAASVEYTIAAATLEMNGWQYRCVITDINGNVTSNAAVLTVIEESLAEEQLRKVKDFYDANKTLTAPLEATALYGAGVDLSVYNAGSLTENAYYLKDSSGISNIIFAVNPGGINVQGQLALLIMDSIALGKNPAALNGKNYVHELNKYQNSSGKNGNTPTPRFDSNASAANNMALLGLHTYWGGGDYPMQNEFPLYIGEDVYISYLLNSYPGNGYVSGNLNGMWGLDTTADNRLVVTYWMMQGLWAAADPSQLTADNIGKSMAFMDSEYAKTGSENKITSSCELMAAYIISRLSYGEEVDDEMWQKLAAFQLEDGSYKRKLTDTESNRESTAMALIALGQNADPEKKSAFLRLSFNDNAAREKAKEDIEAVEKSVAEISLDEENLYPLPTVGEYTTDITWSSSDTVTIEADGTIHAPAEGRDISVTLTAVVNKGTSFIKRYWTFVIKPMDQRFHMEENFAKTKEFYQNKHTLDTAWEPMAVLSGIGSLEGFEFNLPYYGKYYSLTGTADRRASEALAALDTMARGGNPRDYTRNITGSSQTEQVDLIQLILGNQQQNGTIGYEGNFVSDSSHMYYTLALEAYFNGRPWGSEQSGTSFGRIGAIKHIFDKMIDYPLTGGRAYSQILAPNDSTNRPDWFRYHCDLVMLLSRLAEDETLYEEGKTIGKKAQEEMEGILATLKYLFDEGLITNTEPLVRYVSALVAAGQKNKVEEYKVLEVLRNARVGDGSYSYSATAGVRGSNPSGNTAATISMMMALGDLQNNRSILATITFDSSSVSDEEAVNSDLAALSVPETATANITLPTEGPNGSTITWTSSKPQVISTGGVVTRPPVGSADAIVTLVATATRGSVTQTRVFSVTVPAERVISDEELLQADLLEISIPESTIKNISLPASGRNGSAITWTSDNEAVISSDGVVTRPAAGSADGVVILTATAALNEKTASREFTVSVPALTSDIVKEAVNTIREQYNTDKALTSGYWEVFAAKSVLGDDFDKYNFSIYDVRNHRQESSWQPTDYGAVILMILSIGENPYNYKGTNYVQGLLNYRETKNNWGPYAAPIWSGMALEAAGVDISDARRNEYIGYCRSQYSELTYGPDMAGWSLIVLANHLKNEDGSTNDNILNAINQLKAALKASQVQSGEKIALFNTGGVEGGSITMSNACVVSGFMALKEAGPSGFDLTADEWKVNGVGVMDTLYNLEIKDRETFNPQLAIAFGDVYYSDSVWRRVGITKDQFDDVIENAEEILNGNTEEYTEASLQALQAALTAAQAIRSNETKMSKRAFGKEYFDLKDAAKGLVKAGSASIAVIGDADRGIILERTGLEDITGKTIDEIFGAALDEAHIGYTMDNGVISVISGLTAGEDSAWYCYVNGEKVIAPLSAAQLNDGDELVFKYCSNKAAIEEGATLDEHIVTEEAVALTIGENLSEVTEDLTLPLRGAFGSIITWKSSNTQIVSDEGKVTRYATDEEIKLTAKISYGDAEMEKTFDITVKFIEGGAGNITVTFKLIGDSIHGSPYTHTKYETWIDATEVTVLSGAKVSDVFYKVLADNGMAYAIGNSENYISGIRAPEAFGGYWLEEFDNGSKSGWMYMVNGVHPGVGLTEKTIYDGDVILWHYTDEFRLEEGSDTTFTKRKLGEPAEIPSLDKLVIFEDNTAIVFYEDLIPSDTTVTLNDVSNTISYPEYAPGDGMEAAGPIVQLTIDGMDLSNKALLRLDVSSGVSDISEVSVYRFDPAKGEWIRIASDYPEAMGKMLAPISGSGVYGVFKSQDTEPSDFIVERIGEGSFKNGEDANVTVSMTNNGNSSQQATLIICLYDIENGKNEMINYAYASKQVAAKEVVRLTGGFTIPDTGTHKVKVFVWDTFEGMEQLAEPILIEVADN